MRTHVLARVKPKTPQLLSLTRDQTTYCVHSNTKNAFRCQNLVLRDYRFQFNIKILSEGVMMINFISKSLEFV